jgi:hypothetical protein
MTIQQDGLGHDERGLAGRPDISRTKSVGPASNKVDDTIGEFATDRTSRHRGNLGAKRASDDLPKERPRAAIERLLRNHAVGLSE